MHTRFAYFVALLTLLFAATALAGAPSRRITLNDGTVHEGDVLERGDAYVVIKLSDGRLIELQRSAIEVIEVLGGAESYRHEPNRAERPETRRDYYRGPTDFDEEDQPGVQLDGLSRQQLKAKLSIVEGAHALSVAPSIPSLVGGVMLMITAPLVSGNYLWPGQYVMGISLVSGSIIVAAGGAHWASDTVGLREPSQRWGMGLAMAATGAGLFVVPLGLTYGVATGYLPSTGAEPYYTPWMAGSGLGLMIAGSVIMMSDADMSREAVERRLKRWRADNRVVRPQLAGLYAGPGAEGGFKASVTLKF